MKKRKTKAIRKKHRKNLITLLIGAIILLTVSFILFMIAKPNGTTQKSDISDRQKRFENLTASFDDGEMRGIWIATVSNINYPSSKGLSSDTLKNELDSVVSFCEQNSLNSIMFQVRPCSDALYKSDIFPQSAYVSGTQGVYADGDFDSLLYLCEKAHEHNILVFAWVNPLRVSTNENAVLSADNPASIHPEWCVKYGTKTWYNPGLPEVRKLISDGVREIVTGWDVDGIIFDDYFYPYPEDSLEFDDENTYQKYGNGMDKDDWRRENINSIIKDCYTTVHDSRENCWFGVAPFGIWSNDNGTNGGSATRGLDAYSDIYCDSLKWINEGYIDFISPQIYWSFETTAAPYATLVDWWKNAVDGKYVALYVSHAAYRASEWDTDEMSKQITYARESGCNGSIFYGYSAVFSNENGVLDAIASVYSE